MDLPFESNKRETTSRDAFKNTIKQFLSSRESFTNFECISLRLPFGLCKSRRGNTPYDTPGYNLSYSQYSCGNQSLTKSHFPMAIKHSRGKFHNKVIILSQRFETYNKKDRILFSTKQYVNKKDGYLYRWNSSGSIVTISKLIGTTNIDKIKLQVDQLLGECQRFIFVYCQG